MHTNYPDTSVSDALALSYPLSVLSPPNFQDHVFSTHAPGKQAVVDGFVSLVYAVPMPLLILRCYFSSPFMISSTSSARTKLPLPSICPSSLLKLSKFHIHTTKLAVQELCATTNRKVGQLGLNRPVNVGGVKSAAAAV